MIVSAGHRGSPPGLRKVAFAPGVGKTVPPHADRGRVDDGLKGWRAAAAADPIDEAYPGTCHPLALSPRWGEAVLAAREKALGENHPWTKDVVEPQLMH